MSFERRAAELGIEIPVPTTPGAAYITGTIMGRYAYTSGHTPHQDGKVYLPGKLGQDRSVSEGYEAARRAALNCLGSLRGMFGSLDRIRRVAKVVGYVNAVEGFTEPHLVINGASELLLEIFGERGKHVRSAIGVSALPLGAPVEIEVVVELEVE